MGRGEREKGSWRKGRDQLMDGREGEGRERGRGPGDRSYPFIDSCEKEKNVSLQLLPV